MGLSASVINIASQLVRLPAWREVEETGVGVDGDVCLELEALND